MSNFKYLKYKNKYLDLKKHINQMGGSKPELSLGLPILDDVKYVIYDNLDPDSLINMAKTSKKDFVTIYSYLFKYINSPLLYIPDKSNIYVYMNKMIRLIQIVDCIIREIDFFVKYFPDINEELIEILKKVYTNLKTIDLIEKHGKVITDNIAIAEEEAEIKEPIAKAKAEVAMEAYRTAARTVAEAEEALTLAITAERTIRITQKQAQAGKEVESARAALRYIRLTGYTGTTKAEKEQMAEIEAIVNKADAIEAEIPEVAEAIASIKIAEAHVVDAKAIAEIRADEARIAKVEADTATANVSTAAVTYIATLRADEKIALLRKRTEAGGSVTSEGEFREQFKDELEEINETKATEIREEKYIPSINIFLKKYMQNDELINMYPNEMKRRVYLCIKLIKLYFSIDSFIIYYINADRLLDITHNEYFIGLYVRKIGFYNIDEYQRLFKIKDFKSLIGRNINSNDVEICISAGPLIKSMYYENYNRTKRIKATPEETDATPYEITRYNYAHRGVDAIFKPNLPHLFNILINEDVVCKKLIIRLTYNNLRNIETDIFTYHI